MSAKIKYAAQLAHVREVSLLGTADLDYWVERLRGENLTPTEEQGRAQILIIAADSKFMGIRFTELSFSVLASTADGSGAEGAYLLQAFNSVRFFAFCERALFKTPYYPGTTVVRTEVPAAVELTVGGQVVYRAAMQAPSGTQPGDASNRAPTQIGPGGWSGPIYLPGRERLFFATIAGQTQTYPWQAGDKLLLKPTPVSQVVQSLVDSQFEPREWSLRGDASHAKSKTYDRSFATA